MVYMQQNEGFFSAMTTLRGDSSHWKCHGIRFPHPPIPGAEHRTQIWQHREVSGTQPSERNRQLQDAHIEREAIFRDMSNPWQAFRGGTLEKSLKIIYQGRQRLGY